MEVMLTIWGTPAWANGGKGQNYAPTNFADLQNFARALASRYSGRYHGYPFVRYYTVWNESNLGQFLSPQYDSKGKPVAPAIYARLYRAAYAGIKVGNSRALVGIGETSARGRDRFLGKTGHAGDRVAGQVRRAALPAEAADQVRRLVAPPVPDLASTQPPTQNVRWPNVTLTQLPRFEKSLEHVVQAEGRPDLDHGVRLRDEAGRAEGRHLRAAGRVRAAGAEHRRRQPARRDVHLVHPPRRPDEHVAERARRAGRRRRSRRSPRSRASRTSTTGAARRSSSRRA